MLLVREDHDAMPARQAAAGTLAGAARRHGAGVALVCTDIVSFLVAIALASMLISAIGASFTATSAWQRAWSASSGLAWHGWSVAAVLGLMLLFLAERGHYTSRLPFWMATRDIVVACLYALAGDAIATGLIYGTPFRLEPALRWVLLAPLLIAGRAMTRVALNRAGLWAVRVLVAGERDSYLRVREALSSDSSMGYNVSGSIGVHHVRDIGSPSAWRELLTQRNAQMVVLAGHLEQPEAEARLIAALDLARIPFAVIPTVGSLPLARHRPLHFFSHDITFLSYRNNLAQPMRRAAKLTFDVAVAALLVAFLAPVLLVLAALIRMDGGPAVFRHKRIGANGRVFHCLKFRSMRVDAERALQDLLAKDEAARQEWNETQKLNRDPRITRVGQLLRKTSLDELPQLFNVLRGEMSLVGPRPIVQNEVARYGDDIAYYYETRPGLTGLWQVSGRSNTTYERRVRLDVWYVRNWSLWHDIVILLKTIPALLLKRGAV